MEKVDHKNNFIVEKYADTIKWKHTQCSVA